jgi:HlyD family secretion protein
MTRANGPLLIAVGVGVMFLGTLVFLAVQSRPVVEEARYVEVKPADIVLKTVATGAIVPRAEIEIKSRVSGVVDRLYVQPGAAVQAGDPIADIKVIPNSVSLNNASGGLRAAKIELDNARIELERAQGLSERSAISGAELQNARTAYQLAEQSYNAAAANLQIVRDGATRGSGDVSTQVRTTIGGMVLSVDVEQGESVTETNTFNAGTTIAAVADMTDLVFEGNVDESEVGRIREGMPLDITVSALREQRIHGTLEYISPKGVVVDGAVQFEIRASIAATSPDGPFIRAGSSANADIVLDRRDQVMSVDESALRFDGDKVFVELEVGPGRVESREVRVGLSDGLKIEVLEGLSGGERLRVPQGPAS